MAENEKDISQQNEDSTHFHVNRMREKTYLFGYLCTQHTVEGRKRSYIR